MLTISVLKEKLKLANLVICFTFFLGFDKKCNINNYNIFPNKLLWLSFGGCTTTTSLAGLTLHFPSPDFRISWQRTISWQFLQMPKAQLSVFEYAILLFSDSELIVPLFQRKFKLHRIYFGFDIPDRGNIILRFFLQCCIVFISTLLWSNQANIYHNVN